MTKKKQEPERDQQLASAVAAEIAARELERLRYMEQLLGDPRVRVEVPTDGKSGQQQSFSATRRYSVG